MSKLPLPLQKIISQLRKLPGVGAKTAERYAFNLMEWDTYSLDLLATTIASIRKEITPCPTCYCLKGTLPCEFCNKDKRDPHTLCIVSSPKDIYPLEETRIFQGFYHVIGTLFSPLQGNGVEKINLEEIKKRIELTGVKNVILALDSTLEGDATALFLKEEMKNWNVSISRLAFGIPMGSSLEYVDAGTLARAFIGRHDF